MKHRCRPSHSKCSVHVYSHTHSQCRLMSRPPNVHAGLSTRLALHVAVQVLHVHVHVQAHILVSWCGWAVGPPHSSRWVGLDGHLTALVTWRRAELGGSRPGSHGASRGGGGGGRGRSGRRDVCRVWLKWSYRRRKKARYSHSYYILHNTIPQHTRYIQINISLSFLPVSLRLLHNVAFTLASLHPRHHCCAY